jgi:hypothetical protein
MWSNWGRGKNRWEFDHIKPVSSFSDLTQEDQFRECAHYTNIRPLWGDLNHLRMVSGLESLSAQELCDLYDDDFAMLVKPKRVMRKRNPCFEINLRAFGFGRVFGKTEEDVMRKRDQLVNPCTFTEPQAPADFHFPGINPRQCVRNGAPCWEINLRRLGMGRLFAHSRDAVILKFLALNLAPAGNPLLQVAQMEHDTTKVSGLDTVKAVGSIPTPRTTLQDGDLRQSDPSFRQSAIPLKLPCENHITTSKCGTFLALQTDPNMRSSEQ